MPRRPHLAFPLLHVILIASVSIAGVLAFSTGRNMVRHYQLQQDERELRAELRGLERDHGQLEAVRDYLESDEYIEDVARRVLGLVRPGETLVVVAGTSPVAAEATPAAPQSADAPWWRDLFIAPATPAAQPTFSPFD